jgi:O-acetyl-ADP-ribose deacetylase (regulator of RNase III)
MMEAAKGNLLEARVEALVNTVNTVGIMGRGIALQFKQAFPEMYRDYERACQAGEIRLGKMHVFDLGGLGGGPRWIINFPTKSHWRGRSRIEDIESGLQDLINVVRRLKVTSIAVPPLGCGNGGLDWEEVRPRIEAALGEIPNVRALIYPPEGAPQARQMPNRTEPPGMTMGRAALILLMDRYLKGLLDPFVTLLEIHKLMYFLQEAGQPLRLDYQAKAFGPYATNLRQVLIRLETHYTQGYGDGKDIPTKPIELLPGAVEEAEKFVGGDELLKQRIARVARLIEGFEDPYGLELLSSVHWIMRDKSVVDTGLEAITKKVQSWTARKRKVLKAEHIAKAWKRLADQEWEPQLA